MGQRQIDHARCVGRSPNKRPINLGDLSAAKLLAKPIESGLRFCDQDKSRSFGIEPVHEAGFPSVLPHPEQMRMLRRNIIRQRARISTGKTVSRDTGRLIDDKNRRIFVNNRHVKTSVGERIGDQQCRGTVKHQPVTGAQTVAFSRHAPIDGKKSIANRLIDFPARKMRQAFAHESIQANWLMPRRYLPFHRSACCRLIQHIDYRTIPRDLPNKEI